MWTRRTAELESDAQQPFVQYVTHAKEKQKETSMGAHTSTTASTTPLDVHSVVLNGARWRESSVTRRHLRKDLSVNFASLGGKEAQCACLSRWRMRGGGGGGGCRLQILNRIGSNSTAGEVYRVRLDAECAALKIMPRINAKSNQTNTNEIKLAVKVSEAVKSGQTVYFPMIFAHGVCGDTEFDPASTFIDAAHAFATQQMLVSMLETKRERVRFIAETRRMRAQQMCEHILNLKKDITLPGKVPIPSDHIISELADADLLVVIRESPDPDFIRTLISKSFEAAEFLNGTLRIIHNDLHLGNVLVFTEMYIPLIHDFGKSFEFDGYFLDLPLKDRISDATMLVNALVSAVSMKDAAVWKPLADRLVQAEEYLLHFNGTGSPYPALIAYFSPPSS